MTRLNITIDLLNICVSFQYYVKPVPIIHPNIVVGEQVHPAQPVKVSILQGVPQKVTHLGL